MPVECLIDQKILAVNEKLEIFRKEKIKDAPVTAQLGDAIEDLKQNQLFLYFRPVDRIKRMLDPEYENSADDQAKDRFANVKNMFYLLEKNHKEALKFPERQHPGDEVLKLRLAFFDWTYKGSIAKDVPLFVDSKLTSAKTLTDKSLSDAKMKAMTALTFLSIDRDLELREEISRMKKTEADLKMQRSANTDKLLLGMLDTHKYESWMRKQFEFKPLNLTTTILGMMMGVIGLLIGKVWL
jgi:hypothetical protein